MKLGESELWSRRSGVESLRSPLRAGQRGIATMHAVAAASANRRRGALGRWAIIVAGVRPDTSSRRHNDFVTVVVTMWDSAPSCFLGRGHISRPSTGQVERFVSPESDRIMTDAYANSGSHWVAVGQTSTFTRALHGRVAVADISRIVTHTRTVLRRRS